MTGNAAASATAAHASARVSPAVGGVSKGSGRAHSAHAVQPDWLPRGPAAAADKVGSQIYVYWASPTGELNEAWSDDGITNWHTASMPQLGTLFSQPSVVTTVQDNNGHSWQYVFWEGGGEHGLWMAYFNGTWHGAYQINDGPMTSDPTAAYDVTAQNGNVMVVYWRGSDGYTWYTYSYSPTAISSWKAPVKAKTPGGASIGPIDGGESPAASSTCTFAATCTNDDLYWQGSDNALWKATYQPDNNRWPFAPSQANSQQLGSDPSVVVNPNAQSTPDPLLAWRNRGGNANLWFWDTSTPGSQPKDLGCGPLGSAPAITANGTGINTNYYYFWKGDTNNNLYEAYAVPGFFNCPVSLGFGPIGGDPAT